MNTSSDITRSTLSILFIGVLIASCFWIVRPFLSSLILVIAGVIGGLIAFGIIGLFIGPVLLAVTYTLPSAWVGSDDGESGPAGPETATTIWVDRAK